MKHIRFHPHFHLDNDSDVESVLLGVLTIGLGLMLAVIFAFFFNGTSGK